MVDYGDVIGSGFATGIGMLWSAVTANPWVAILFAGIVVATLWMQLSPRRRRRRR